MGKKILAILGKTSTGKSTVSDFVAEKYGIESLVSYTTRSKRCDDVPGHSHYFITDEEMNELEKNKESMLGYKAFVEEDGRVKRYCALYSQLQGRDVWSYVIDPDGLQWLMEHYPEIEVVTIFLDLDEDVIRARASNRGTSLCVVEKRLNSERSMFEAFKESGKYDLYVDCSLPLESVLEQVSAFVESKF